MNIPFGMGYPSHWHHQVQPESLRLDTAPIFEARRVYAYCTGMSARALTIVTQLGKKIRSHNVTFSESQSESTCIAWHISRSEASTQGFIKLFQKKPEFRGLIGAKQSLHMPNFRLHMPNFGLLVVCSIEVLLSKDRVDLNFPEVEFFENLSDSRL